MPAPLRSTLPALLALLALTGCDTAEDLLDYTPDAAPIDVKVGDDCDPDRPLFCSGDRIARCDDAGEVIELRPACDAGLVCAEGNGIAECALAGRAPCAFDHCDDGEQVRCGASGFAVEREACLGDRVCAEGNDTLDCVLPGLAPCTVDRCADDGSRVEVCGRTGHVDQWIGCGDAQVCAEAEGYAACVADPAEPCASSVRVCADGEVQVTPCDETLGLSRGVETLHVCDAESDRCAEVDGVADCALDEPVPCAVEQQEVDGERVRATADEAPTLCLDDRLMRCNAHGRLATVAACDLGCEMVQYSERTWLAACR